MSAQFHGGNGGLDIGNCGYHDDTEVWPIGTYFSKHFNAGQPGHIDIQHHHINTTISDNRQGFFAVSRDDGFLAGGL
jgi:hypothetical protein